MSSDVFTFRLHWIYGIVHGIIRSWYFHIEAWWLSGVGKIFQILCGANIICNGCFKIKQTSLTQVYCVRWRNKYWEAQLISGGRDELRQSEIRNPLMGTFLHLPTAGQFGLLYARSGARSLDIIRREKPDTCSLHTSGTPNKGKWENDKTRKWWLWNKV